MNLPPPVTPQLGSCDTYNTLDSIDTSPAKQQTNVHTQTLSKQMPNIIFWNVHAFKNFYDEIDAFKCNDIICLSETWLTRPNVNLPISLDTYDLNFSHAIKNNEKGRAIGGLLILINPNFYDYSIIAIKPHWIFVIVKCKTSGTSFIVGNVYFSPSYDYDEILNLLDLEITQISLKFANLFFVIGGDFNTRVASLN